jgi:hypothetical protein
VQTETVESLRRQVKILKHDLANANQKWEMLKEYKDMTRVRGHRDWIEDVYGLNKHRVEQIRCPTCKLEFSGLPHRSECRLCSIK